MRPTCLIFKGNLVKSDDTCVILSIKANDCILIQEGAVAGDNYLIWFRCNPESISAVEGTAIQVGKWDMLAFVPQRAIKLMGFGIVSQIGPEQKDFEMAVKITIKGTKYCEFTFKANSENFDMQKNMYIISLVEHKLSPVNLPAKKQFELYVKLNT